MKFIETSLQGAFVLELEPRSDDRGFFSRAFCAREFESHGLKPQFVQCNLALTRQKATLRGLHYQTPPAAEAKFFRCIQGANYHVIVDLRPESRTYGQHVGIELSAENHRGLYVPELFAHGYQSLVDNSEALYQVSEFYSPNCEQGLRYDDPVLNIHWPLPVSKVSDKDLAWPTWQRQSATAQISN